MFKCKHRREHAYKDTYFESREPGEVSHWVEKNAMSTLMDLNGKMACGSLADVALNPSLEISSAAVPLKLVL